MIPRRSRLYHLPYFLSILWSSHREAGWRADPPRQGGWSDLQAMARIIRRGWVRHLRDAYGPAAFIARDNEVIHALYVHPRARGRGAGRTLMQEAKAKTERLELWAAEANHPARAFYRAQGFAEVAWSDGNHNDENLPEILCVWQKEPAYG